MIERIVADVPVVWLDIKGAHYDAPVAEPLEASVLITHGLSHEAHAAQTLIAYPPDELAEIRKRAYVGLLKNKTMDDVRDHSERHKDITVKAPQRQVYDFWRGTIVRLLEHLPACDVWLPVWNGDYEKEIVDEIIKRHESDDHKLRYIEMQSVSAFAVDVLGMDYPERGTLWRSLESLRWYFQRTREIFGVAKARSRFDD